MLAEITKPIHGQLERVRLSLVEALGQSGSHWVLKRVVETSLSRKGKLLRPIVALHCGEALGSGVEHLVQAATTVELIHMATIIHDDVIDDSSIRRGKPSVNSDLGNSLAVLGGDYLFACALRSAAKLGSEAVLEMGETVEQIVEGELAQLAGLHTIGSLEEYIRRIQQKTGALFAASARLAAIAAGAPHTIRALSGQFGLTLGTLYQIRDDYLDIFGSEDQLGKPVGSDLVAGVVTLPVILASSMRPNPGLQSLIEDGTFDNKDYPELRDWIRKSGALEEMTVQVKQLQERALAALSCLPQGPGTQALALCVTHAAERFS
jgi:geranylgeranyl pyrophosphate synthase